MVTYGSNGRTCTSKERRPVVAESYFAYDAQSGFVAINTRSFLLSYLQCKPGISSEIKNQTAEIMTNAAGDDDSSSEDDCLDQKNRKKGNTFNVLRDIFPEARENAKKTTNKEKSETPSLRKA
jgi:hypothetical protein